LFRGGEKIKLDVFFFARKAVYERWGGVVFFLFAISNIPFSYPEVMLSCGEAGLES
jgi:hypothetical protein